MYPTEPYVRSVLGPHEARLCEGRVERVRQGERRLRRDRSCIAAPVHFFQTNDKSASDQKTNCFVALHAPHIDIVGKLGANRAADVAGVITPAPVVPLSPARVIKLPVKPKDRKDDGRA